MLPSYAGGAHRVVVRRSEIQDVSFARRAALPAALLALAVVACVLTEGSSGPGMTNLNQLGVQPQQPSLPPIPQAPYPLGALRELRARTLGAVCGSSPREASS